MAQKKKAPRAIDELIEEVRDLKELVAKIEKRSIYLRPDGALKAAGKNFTAGILRGLGVLIGGIVFVIIFGFLVREALTSEQVQSYIGEQIQSAVTNAIDKQLNNLPFGR